jgi:hypothetical protein
MAIAVGGNQRAIALFEGCICVVLGRPGTVHLRTKCHENRAPISRNTGYGFRMNRGCSGVVNTGSVWRTAHEKEIGGRASCAPRESHARGSKCRSWRRAKHH